MDAANITVLPEYSPHPHHRNRTPDKAQWHISETEETQSFMDAWQSEWYCGLVGWGFHRVAGRLRMLGVVKDHKTETFFTKFVRDPSHPTWHGYPANQTKAQDRPDLEITRKWLQAKLLPKAKIRKLLGGQPCLVDPLDMPSLWLVNSRFVPAARSVRTLFGN